MESLHNMNHDKIHAKAIEKFGTETVMRGVKFEYPESTASVISATFVMILALGIIVVTVMFGSNPNNVQQANNDAPDQVESAE